jgi:20S proteasome alpha/beta subunit
VALSHFIQRVPGAQPTSPASALLACGFDPDHGGWIIEIDPHCQVTSYTQRGFHAVGSGASFAHLANALLAHFEVRSRTLRHCKLVAHRAISTVIESSAYGVGGPVRMWSLDGAGCRELSQEEMNQIEADVDMWKDLERERLDEFLSPNEPSSSIDMPPVINLSDARDGGAAGNEV